MTDTVKQKEYFHPEDWITQSEGARIRGVSRQSIHDLVERGRLSTLVVGGIRFVNREEVEAYTPAEPGRPAKEQANDC